MRFFKVGVASLMAVAFAGVMTVGAANAVTKPGAPAVSKSVELVKGKKHHHHHGHHHHWRHHHHGGGCKGAYMYWDKKGHKCADARMKKTS